MSNAAAQEYLQQALAVDAWSQPGALLRLRREYLRPADVIVADTAEEHDDNLRTRMLHRLHAVRRDFWILPADELAQQLATLRQVAIAETVVAATRLQQVAAQRETLRQLIVDRNVHPAFVKALAELLIAPAATANLLREREHNWMRPEQNPQHERVRQAVQGTVHYVRTNYPTIFALEEAWLVELLEYSPLEETQNVPANILFGLVAIAGALFTLFINVNIVRWMFS